MTDDTSKPLDPSDLPEFWSVKPLTKTERAYRDGGKVCTQCRSWKRLDQFHVMDVPTAVAATHSWCKSCRNTTHVVKNPNRRSRCIKVKR